MDELAKRLTLKSIDEFLANLSDQYDNCPVCLGKKFKDQEQCSHCTEVPRGHLR